MAMLLTCDITGLNSAFKITNYKISLSKPATGTTRKFALPQSGYKENFVLQRVTANNTLETLTQGNSSDYFFADEDRDIEGEKLIKNAYPEFNKQIFKAVCVRGQAFNENETSNFYITYQSVFPNVLSSGIDQQGNPTGPTCTPELLKEIVDNLLMLKLRTAGEDVIYSTAEGLPSPLKMDLTGTHLDNFIEHEAHPINSSTGHVVIRPYNGSFYGHDIRIVTDLDEELREGTDYQVQALDIESTKICEHESGVWRYIVIKKPYVGTVFVSYHAFGGEVSVLNFVSIRNQFQALKDYINKGAFLTVNTVSAAPIINEMIARLDTLDRYYLSLNMSGYRNMSNRFIAIRGTSNTNDNWYTIAYLYRQTDYSTDPTQLKVYTNDSVRLKIRIDEHDAVMDLYIYGNVKTGSLRIKSMEADIGKGNASPSDYSKFEAIPLPEFRLVWREDNNYEHGAALQMRISVPETEGVTVLVENHNKAGLGGWVLRGDANGTDEVVPENTSVLLPDGKSAWSTGQNYCYSTGAYPEYTKGVLAWAGSVALHKADRESYDTDDFSGLVLNPIDESTITCTNIKNVTFCIFDRCFDQYIYKTVTIESISTNNLYAQCVIDALDNDYVRIKIAKDANTSKMKYTLNAVLGTKSRLMHRFDLRQLSFNTVEA